MTTAALDTGIFGLDPRRKSGQAAWISAGKSKKYKKLYKNYFFIFMRFLIFKNMGIGPETLEKYS